MNSTPIRGRRTAYAFYVQSCREEFEREHPNETPDFIGFIKNCASQWDDMSELEKAPYQQLADVDKKRYEKEVRNNGGDECDKQKGKKRKDSKDDTEPKRPLSAFYWYCCEQRSIVIAENPNFNQGQVAVEMGRRWIAASSEVKEKFEEIADKDAARYDNEMAAFKRKNDASSSEGN